MRSSSFPHQSDDLLTDIDPEVIRDLFEKLVSEGGFRKRQESWIAVSEDWFFKVPRCSNDVRADATHRLALAKAQLEYQVLAQLTEITTHVVRPLMVIPELGCLVLPRIYGDNARDILLRETDIAAVNRTALAGIEICASLHAPRHFPKNVARLDYAKDPFGEAAFAPQSPEFGHATLVVHGFEIRNVMMRGSDGFPVFFDPHDVGIGHPEEDVARYIISLLMVTWGHGGGLRIWQTFSAQRVIDRYEDEAQIALDPARLTYFMRRALRMREHYARQSKSELPRVFRALGSLYQLSFFEQLKRWMAKNGF
jgi:hypothetical protein